MPKRSGTRFCVWFGRQDARTAGRRPGRVAARTGGAARDRMPPVPVPPERTGRVGRHTCSHDATVHEHSIRSAQRYRPRRHRGERSRRSLEGDGEWEPLRLRTSISATAALTDDERTFLSTLIDGATSWLESALRVRPVLGSLRAARMCAGRYPGGVCAASTTLCAFGDDGQLATVDEELLDELRVCSACAGDDCELAGSVCTTLPASTERRRGRLRPPSPTNGATCPIGRQVRRRRGLVSHGAGGRWE